jgi:hypothetical protein
MRIFFFIVDGLMINKRVVKIIRHKNIRPAHTGLRRHTKRVDETGDVVRHLPKMVNQ